MNKEQILKQYFSELAKKSVESRRHKYGAEGFVEFMRNIAKLKRKNRSRRAS